ncbi:MAG TPA: ribosome maturation factor RimM [Alphaproteobacteria bacterium]|nr:ribosome maturation factor RimM [Alphaproteobacteria bacterium]
MARPERKVCLGVIKGAHGVRGQVRVQSFTADPDAIFGYGPLSDEAGRRELTLERVGETRGQLVAHVQGVDSRDAAEALKGFRLHVSRAALPPPADEEYYHGDLIGLAAERADGVLFGKVRAVHDFGAGSVLEIARPEGAPIMLPFTRAVVPVVDIAGGRVVVEPPPSLVADEVGGEEHS